MNERIRDMWARCVTDSVPPRGKPMNFQVAADKFAELIVRECVTKMALEIMNNSWIDDAVKNTYEHFGVE